MREALGIINRRAPDLEVDGEMHGDADGMLCGTFGTHALHLHYIDQVIGRRSGVGVYAAMNAVLLPNRTVFIADTYVNADPSAEEIAEIAM